METGSATIQAVRILLATPVVFGDDEQWIIRNASWREICSISAIRRRSSRWLTIHSA